MDALTEGFEKNREHLRAIAWRMLGTPGDADDAVQEAWLRLSSTDPKAIDNLGGFLTTVVARVCLDMLRTRRSRREDSGGVIPEAAANQHVEVDPTQQRALAESIGPAMLVVLDTLGPAERIAFVLHDLFAVSFDEIGPIVGRSSLAARKLASRARQRVRGAPATAEADLARQRRVVDAFLAAAHNHDFDALLAVLDPNVVVRADATAVKLGAAPVQQGAREVATVYKGRAAGAQYATVDGLPAAAWAPHGKLMVVFDFAIEGDRIVEIELLGDPATHAQLQVEL
ncbi:MAG: sigma-70 family RNA polymerase sigma factor [Myxococcaceae bacterium]